VARFGIISFAAAGDTCNAARDGQKTGRRWPATSSGAHGGMDERHGRVPAKPMANVAK
jgi:hypothetical protein